MKLLGIDIGGTGAIAGYDGNELTVVDMPVHEITKGRSKRKRLDPYTLIRVLEESEADMAYVERVSAQPMNGAAHAFTYGSMAMGVEVALAATKIPVTMVTPQMWKKEMNCPRDKDGARMRASQLLPDYSDMWKLKKHDGRAEAALIALYGYRKEAP